MSDAKPPDEIYLQCDDDGWADDDTTWCRDKINDQDIKYVRVASPVSLQAGHLGAGACPAADDAAMPDHDVRLAEETILDIERAGLKGIGHPDAALYGGKVQTFSLAILRLHQENSRLKVRLECDDREYQFDRAETAESELAAMREAQELRSHIALPPVPIPFLHNDVSCVPLSYAETLYKSAIELLAATQSARDQWMAQYTESNTELMRMRKERDEAASSWEKLLLEFEDFINEPPQYEEMFRVREYRHELYPKWRIVSNAALALLAAKQSRIDELEKTHSECMDRETVEQLLESTNPFCGHPSVLTVTHDGGKTNHCTYCDELAAKDAEISALKVDAERYRIARLHIAPRYLADSMCVSCLDLPKNETIPSRIDKLCDAARAEQRKQNGN